MLLKALQNYITPQVTPTKTYPDVNLLNQILYGQFTASTHVVWYDSNQQTFIDQGYKGNALVYSIIRKIAEKGKRGWVKECWRGDASKGTIFKDYKIGIEDEIRRKG